ncbi:Sec-independent protein translocase subunit TatA/TatB [Pontibacter sp. CAU 1760]
MSINTIFLFLGGLGGTEILLILFVILLLFGAKRIPELARGMGRGIREFKDATKEIKNDIESSVNDDTHRTTK